MPLTTEEQAARKAFEAALRENLRARARLIVDTEGAIARRLRTAAGAIAAMLAEQPADWRQWQLQAIQQQVEALLQGMQGDVATAADAALQAAWQAGVAGVDAPLQAAAIHVDIYLPVLDTAILTSVRGFTAGRIKDLAAEALGKIDSALSLVTLGASTPFEAVKAVQAQLGTKDQASLRRATTIVRTELGQAYALGGQARMTQAAELVPGLQKQWRRSGKIHSRWSHDAMDGVVVDAGKPYRVPTKQAGGVVLMMHPHDPKAPASETINCGCTSRPWMNRWGLPPGGTPFSEREVRLNPMKAAGKGWLAGVVKGAVKAATKTG